jgi:uncharacterized membrane protein YfcA
VATELIVGLILVFSISVIALMFTMYFKDKANNVAIARSDKLKLVATGILGFISDSVGIGSFAVVIALSKAWKIIKDENLPGAVNSAQILPGAIEAIIFLHIVHVDLITLITLIAGTCIGGSIGGLIVSNMNKKHIQISMFVAFLGMAVVILLNQIGLLPVGGTATMLTGWKLWVGFFGTIICGFLPAVGVGLFVVVEILLFLLGMSPLIAFPIMTAAGALQQPLTCTAFVLNRKVPLKKVFIISLTGVIGVFIATPFVTSLSPYILRWLMFLIVTYNAVTLIRSYNKPEMITP